MAGGFQDDDNDLISEINVTPFVDVVLVLLIIFMVTSIYIVKASMEVELPQAASAGAAVESTLNIVITRQGEIFLNGDPTNPSELARIVANQTAENPKTQAVIAADKAVPYGEVTSVLDIVKLGGVKSFALNFERAPRQ